MKAYRSLLLVGLLCTCIISNAQDSVFSRNSIYIEILGNAGVFSLNYERALAGQTYGRFGFGSWSSTFFMGNETKITTFPVMVTHFTGQKSSHFEFGGGILAGSLTEYGWFNDKTTYPIFDLIFLLGYRYQALGKGLLFRIGLTPFISLDNKAKYPDAAMLSGGAAIGYHF
jgi:hypothetical protein